MLFLITYDLNKQKDYAKLYEALKALGEWKRDPGLDSVWFVSTSLNAEGINSKILPNVDDNDRFFITQIERGKHQGWLNKDVWDWINARL